MTEDNEDILDIDAFIKLLKVAQNSNSFESHKTLFLYSSHLPNNKKGGMHNNNTN